ncbi:Lactaldehyde dehydrogenase [Geodia barretti]|uniref:NADP-dependent glyceraldehyde-3-phosphate dehydrogenase n=1 Tax=Geodia barretti TaxID=519541 RepID=A0AA35RER5_GEOBA|nr:Lactaldehyde dehydrogenase [Geodia barretti]
MASPQLLSISPFNIQDEFNLSNFTVEQVRELLTQYTEETGQFFAPEVIEIFHKQTGGQPFLINRFAQILTEELEIPKAETITMAHFSEAYVQLLDEDNTNISHLLTNIRRDPRFESFLMRIASYDKGIHFSRDNEIIAELATYGVITKDTHRMCKINIDWAMWFVREVESGNLMVNWATQWRADLMPYGGVRKSGMGKEGPKSGIEEMTELKMAIFHLDS